MKALSKLPGERYSSVRAFAEALTESASAEPTVSASDSSDEKAGLFGKVRGLFRRG